MCDEKSPMSPARDENSSTMLNVLSNHQEKTILADSELRCAHFAINLPFSRSPVFPFR
jgi:hypothetical protein